MIFRGSFIIILFLNLLFASDYTFEAVTNKHTIHSGEKFQIRFIFRFADEKKLADINFNPPIFKDIHIISKEINSTKTTQSWIYTLSTTAQKDIAVGSAYLDIAIKKNIKKHIGEFDDLDYDYLSLETKPLFISIQKGDKKSELYGEFNISSKVDKTSLYEDESINFEIYIKGSGNLYDIQKFQLNIPNATVYSDSPTITKETFSQKFSITASESFTIPPFEIKYIDKNSKKEVIKKTKAIFIDVLKKSTTDKESKTQTKTNLIYIVLSFLVGFVVAYLFKSTRKRKKKVDMTFIQKLKDAKDTKEILQILLLTNNKKYKQLIQKLENDIYISGDKKLTKKEILKLIFTTD